MKVVENPSLRKLNTFGTQASASLLFQIETEEDLLSLPSFNPQRDLVLGGGSNVLITTDVPGAVYLNRIRGIHSVAESGDSVFIEAAAGEAWHDLVNWSLDHQLSGLENLSLIPGLVGAAPIQNIGAYGVELASVLESVTAWDWKHQRWVSLCPEDCHLAYRDSLFKSGQPNRYLITSVRLKLSRHFVPHLEYSGLREELGNAGIGLKQLTARDVSDAVIRIRTRKLPDPARLGNAGSFFKNPLVERTVIENLLGKYPSLPSWPGDSNRQKVSAAWMIEQCGLKGVREKDAGVSAQHALVLVNHGSASGAELLSLARRIQSEVLDQFGIRLEPEPRIVEFKA